MSWKTTTAPFSTEWNKNLAAAILEKQIMIGKQSSTKAKSLKSLHRHG